MPSVHWLPKISFSWPNCLNAKVYLCCFCACLLLRLSWHLASYAWVTWRSSVSLYFFEKHRCQESLRLLPSEQSSCQPLNCLQFFWGCNSCTEIQTPQTHCKTWQKFPSNFQKHEWHQINLCKQDTEVLYGINAAQHPRVLPTEKDKCLNIAGLCGLHYWHYNLLCFGWGNQHIRREIKQKPNWSAIKLLKPQPQSLLKKKQTKQKLSLPVPLKDKQFNIPLSTAIKLQWTNNLYLLINFQIF